MALEIFEDSISSERVYLIFSPLTTSYTGIYTCILTITPSSQTPHVTAHEPVQSSVKDITVQSKVHSILHVLVHIPLTSLSHSPTISLSLLLLPLSVPKPDIVVSVSPTGPLYAGTSIILTCSVTLDPAVNNNENIDIVWNCPENIACDEQERILTSAMGEFNISPVAVQDNGTLLTMGTAGEQFQLICTVTTVENLVESALVTVQWSGGSVGSDGVTEDNTTNSGVSTLTFNPLLTSHGAQYTCQAMINIPSINVIVTSSGSTNVMVRSK